MDKKKIRQYIVLILAILLVSVMLPYGIDAVSRFIVGKISDNAETESEPGAGPETEDAAEEKASAAGKSGKPERATEKNAEEEEPLTLDETESESQEIPAESEEDTEETQTEPPMETEAWEAAFGLSPGDSSGEVNPPDTYLYDEELKDYRESVNPEYTETTPGGTRGLIGNRQKQFNSAIADYVFSLYGNSVEISRVDVVEFVDEDEAEITYQIEVFTGDGSSELFLCSYNKTWDFYGIYPYTSM